MYRAKSIDVDKAEKHLDYYLKDLTTEEILEKTKIEKYYEGYRKGINIAKDMFYCSNYEIKESEDNQKLIEKLEKRRKQNNDRYGQSIDNDEFPEMYEYGAYVKEDDYILSLLKGEKE